MQPVLLLVLLASHVPIHTPACAHCAPLPPDSCMDYAQLHAAGPEGLSRSLSAGSGNCRRLLDRAACLHSLRGAVVVGGGPSSDLTCLQHSIVGSFCVGAQLAAVHCAIHTAFPAMPQGTRGRCCCCCWPSQLLSRQPAAWGDLLPIPGRADPTSPTPTLSLPHCSQQARHAHERLAHYSMDTPLCCT
jgi:hypothetical protein